MERRSRKNVRCKHGLIVLLDEENVYKKQVLTLFRFSFQYYVCDEGFSSLLTVSFFVCVFALVRLISYVNRVEGSGVSDFKVWG